MPIRYDRPFDPVVLPEDSRVFLGLQADGAAGLTEKPKLATNVIITAIGGQDKPGIIAALTKAVFEAGGNLDDATMTRLRGAFANMLAATLPDGESAASLRARLGPIGEALGLYVSVEEIPGGEHAPDPEPDHVITVYGADHPGIVHRITSSLADRGANITDLDTRRRAGTAQSPIYIMVLETSGGAWDLSLSGEFGLRRRLELKVDISVRPIETEAL